MSRTLDFFVAGRAVPQGSHDAPQAGVVIDRQNRKTKRRKAGGLDTWRRAVSWSAAGAKAASGWLPRGPAVGPVWLDLVFTLERPPSVTREAPSVRPDLDKLTRAVGDALSGVLYIDDAQVTELSARKIYGPEPGVRISVRWAGAASEEKP